MKIFQLVFILILFTTHLNAQNWCGSFNPSEWEWKIIFPNPALLPDPLVTKTLNIAFWRVCNTDGSGLENLKTDTELLDVLSSINQNFLPYKIQFKLVNSGIIQNTAQANPNLEFEGFSNSTPNAINVYYVQTLPEAGVVVAHKNVVKLRTNDWRNAITHEIGHVFGLEHTFESGYGAGVENIVRVDIDGCLANHTHAGDFISDTEADYDARYPIRPDQCGNTNFNRPEHNYMTYSEVAPLEFTPQQVKVMHFYIEVIKESFNLSDDTTPVQFKILDQNNSGGFFPQQHAIKLSNEIKAVIHPDDIIQLYPGENYFPEVPIEFQIITDKTHFNWDGELIDFKLKNSYIHLANNVQKICRYNTPITATFSSSSLDGAAITSSPYLSDPWYADANGNQDLGLLPVSGSKSVFKDQLPQSNTSIPFYQIKADPISVNNGLSLSFQNWESFGTRPLLLSQSSIQPVVFNNNAPTITANYKAMLASKTTGWVGTQFASNNGTSSVMYASEGNLWLHRENGSDKKEILVNSSAGSISSYSVTANGNNRYWVLNNGTTTPVSGYELNGATGVATVPALSGLTSSSRIEIVRINSTTPKLALITKIGLTIYKSIGTLTSGVVSWGSWSSLTVGANAIQVAGNGNLAYVVWIQGSSVLGNRLNSDGSWSTSKVITSSSSGSFTSLATAANGSNGLDLVVVRANSQTNKKDLAVSAWNADNTTLPLTVLSTSTTYGDFKAVSLSSNSGLKLASVGVSTYVPNYSYYLWKHDHTSWSQESSHFSMTEQKLFHQEVTFTPSKATIGALEVMTPNPVNWGEMTKITIGTEEQPVLSISGVELTDTLVYNVNMDPAIVDSIIIDTLGVWSIAVKGSGFVTEIVNDLKLFGTSELVVTTTESGTSRSITFKPYLVKWDVWVVDPSGNKVRMGKENSEEESASESIKTEVAVYPNPFNPETRINIRLAEPAELKVRVYNVVGQLVADLANGHHDMGDYSFRFDGKNLASGTYFYRVEIGEKVKTGKLQLLK